MAKRFTDTEKWKKPFLRSLQGSYKLLWFYICDDCDHAGIWQVDMDVARIRTGEKSLNQEKAVKALQEKIVVFDSGKKWFIPSFIEFQYPKGLNPTNKAHGSVINILSKYNLIDEEFKPLTSPLQGAKDMELDMDMEEVKDLDTVKDKDKDKGGPKTKSTYQLFNDAYFDWYVKMNGLKPKFDDLAGKSLKTIITYLVSLAKDKNHPPEYQESEALKSWNYILANWGKIDPFIAAQVDIKNIASNINRIITDLKNGRRHGKQPTGSEVSTESLAAKIAHLTKQDERPGIAS